MDAAFVTDAVERASRGESKCAPEVLTNLSGMSGSMTRHLYNNVCSFRRPDGEPTRYLEIGCWQGSSTVAALYGNGGHVRATVVDNWSEFGGPRAEFIANMMAYVPDAAARTQIIEEDAFERRSALAYAPYDIYLYDGHHSAESHEKALVRYYDALAPRSLVLIDDWDWQDVRDGTYRGLEKLGLHTGPGGGILHFVDVRQPAGADGFWNGCGLFLIDKASISPV